MGRKKSFDENAVLDLATEEFWRRGYNGTTYQILEASSGISGRSLINCFGDKDSLFCQVLDGYSDTVGRELKALEGKGTGVILNFFKSIASAPVQSPRNCGCLMANTLAETRGGHPAIAQSIARFRKQFRDFFSQALMEEGIADHKQKADLLVTLLWGCSADIRLQGSVKALRPTIKSLEDLLAQWTAV